MENEALTDVEVVDSLLDSLILVARHHGRAASRASLSAGLPLIDGKLTPELLARAADRAGMTLRISVQEIDNIPDFLLPAILLMKDGRACVLQTVDRENNKYAILTPESGGGTSLLAKEELLKHYSGRAAFASPRLRFDIRTPNIRHIKSEHWFWTAILKQRGTYRDVVFGALLINLFALGLPIFVMNVYDRVVPNSAVETLWALAAGIVMLLIADFVLRRLRAKLVDQASARIDTKISAILMEKVLGIRYSERPVSAGSFASNIRAFEQVREFIASSTILALVDLPFVFLYLALIAWISPPLALPGLVMFLIIVVFGYVVQERLHLLSESNLKAGALRNALLVESLFGLETVKTQRAESIMQSRWEESTRYSAKVNIESRDLTSLATSGAYWFQQMTSVIVIASGVYLISEHLLTMGGLIASYMLTTRALAPAGQVVGLLLQYQNAKTALTALDTFMKLPSERDDSNAYVEHRISGGAIEFRNVSFAYPGRQDPALQNMTFRINPGERVAILGRVGSGKSTIQRLIVGLYPASEGTVLIDGVDIRQIDPADLRDSIGFVSQDVVLFFGSLRENIALGNPRVDDEAILKAADVAGLSDFIKMHPMGLSMPVGERGELLSGGQRQAVGIARALLHSTPVLLMDEPTGAMDFSTEAALANAIKQHCAGRTLVVVTHRSTLLTLCDRIIVVDSGKVVADGPRESVMSALSSGKISKAAP